MRLSKIGFQHDGTAPVALEQEALDQVNPALGQWLRMRACIARIDGEINGRMRQHFGLSMPQFEVLKRLQASPDGLRMGEVAQILNVSGASITAITDQLEDGGLVMRVQDRVDRRVSSVRMTVAGRQILARAAIGYQDWVIELMSDTPFVELEHHAGGQQTVPRAVLGGMRVANA